MIDSTFQGLRIEATARATGELLKENMDLDDVADILELGFDCGSGPRSEEIIERCQIKRSKLTKVVVAKTEVDYHDGFNETLWLLVHVGKLTASKKHKQK